MFEGDKVQDSIENTKCNKKRKLPVEYFGEIESEETKKLKSETISFSNQEVMSELDEAEETYQKFIKEFEIEEVNELECEDNSPSDCKVKRELDEAEKIYQKFIRESIDEQKVKCELIEAEKIYQKFIDLSYDSSAKPDIECIICKKKFSCANSYYSHKSSLRHKKREAAQEKFECEICNLTFWGKEQFNFHMNANKHKKKFRNWQLEKELEKKYKLSMIPTINVDGTDYYFCQLCNKKCLTLVTYDTHISSALHKRMIEEHQVKTFKGQSSTKKRFLEHDHQAKTFKGHINTKYISKNNIVTSRGRYGKVRAYQNIPKMSWRSQEQPRKVKESPNIPKMSWEKSRKYKK